MMKFVCDQMLAGLGKWLRIAGYDTKIIETSLNDREILKCALEEGRLLLTRDKHFLEMRSPEGMVIFLKSNTLEECIKELNSKLKIDWLCLSFTRCIICNSLLIEPDQTSMEQAPPDVRLPSKQCLYCSQCRKLYWEGSHTERMLKQLKVWQFQRSELE